MNERERLHFEGDLDCVGVPTVMHLMNTGETAFTTQIQDLIDFARSQTYQVKIDLKKLETSDRTGLNSH
jgi:hypothetical protein